MLDFMAKGPSVRGQGMRLGLCSGVKGLYSIPFSYAGC